MDYRKEQNFIVAYDGDSLRGKWNILNNQYIGIKGGIVKNRPTAFSVNAIRQIENEVIQSALEFASDISSHWGDNYSDAVGKRVEEVVSVGLVISGYYTTYNFMEHDRTRLTKECVDYIKTHFEGRYNEISINNYKMYHKYRDIFSQFEEVHHDWVRNVLVRVSDAVPQDFVIGMIKRAIHEKIFFEYDGYMFARMIDEWNYRINAMGDKLEVKHNILTNYAILKWVYEQYKNAHYDENLKKHNDVEWLYFEDENYIIRPLLTRAEFHEEAEAQHNCVERMYMEKVADGDTHVVVVRHKSNPTESLITCEVRNNGRIQQFLHRFNRSILTNAEHELESKYQLHLLSYQ